MPKTASVDFKAVKAAITMEQVLQHYGLLEQFKRGTDSLNGPCPIHKGSNRIAEHLKEADRNLAEKSALLLAHQQEIQKVRDEMTRTHKLYIQEQITAQGFGEFYKPAEERLNQLLAELPKLEAEEDFLKVNKLSAADVVHESNSLQERWPSLPVVDKRKIVEALIEKVVIGDGEIDITFSHLKSSEEQCKSQQGKGSG